MSIDKWQAKASRAEWHYTVPIELEGKNAVTNKQRRKLIVGIKAVNERGGACKADRSHLPSFINMSPLPLRAP